MAHDKQETYSAQWDTEPGSRLQTTFKWVVPEPLLLEPRRAMTWVPSSPPGKEALKSLIISELKQCRDNELLRLATSSFMTLRVFQGLHLQ